MPWHDQDVRLRTRGGTVSDDREHRLGPDCPCFRCSALARVDARRKLDSARANMVELAAQLTVVLACEKAIDSLSFAVKLLKQEYDLAQTEYSASLRQLRALQ